MEATRPAAEADVSRLAELCRQALAEVGGRERGGAVFVAREARAEPVEESLLGDMADPERIVLVGTIDGVVVGYATGRTEELRDGTILGVVDDLFVEEGARSVGVGECMMDDLLGWFRGRACSGVDAFALPGDRATKNFFEECGFSARLLVMHHRFRG